MKHALFISFALVSALTATAFAQTITPTRVGPVSQYGQLITGKTSQGKGQIYGSCEGVKDGAEVQVRGMSLYWSLMPQAVEFWSEEGITTMVNDMKIQIVRAAMATGNEDWQGGYKGYASDPNTQKNLVKTVVEAAIKNDIYVIIDWHSHQANKQTDAAKNFFKEMAETYGQYDNVIFEVFNEPEQISWGEVKNYANQVIEVIRQYSDNLVLVGNPSWDQNPSDAIGNEVTDPKNNTAYTLHYYANSHNWEGSYQWGESEGLKGEKAVYTVTLKSFRRRILPDDAAFAEKAKAESFDKLKATIRESMEKSAVERESVRRENEAIELLMKKVEFDVPGTQVRRATDGYLNEFAQRAQYSGLDAEYFEKNREKILKDAEDAATRQVRLWYVLDAIAKAEKIEAKEDEVGKKVVEFILANAKK